MIYIKLSIKDRLNMPRLYPEQGNLLTQLLVKDLITKVSLTQKEVEKFEVIVGESQVTWNVDKAEDKEVVLTEAELNLLKEQVRKLDEENKITQDLVDLCLSIRDFKEEKKDI